MADPTSDDSRGRARSGQTGHESGDDPTPADVAANMTAAAGRLGELADTAELMGDEAAAAGLREQATAVRMAAMKLLD